MIFGKSLYYPFYLGSKLENVLNKNEKNKQTNKHGKKLAILRALFLRVLSKAYERLLVISLLFSFLFFKAPDSLKIPHGSFELMYCFISIF